MAALLSLLEVYRLRGGHAIQFNVPDTMPRVRAPDDEALEAACAVLAGYGLRAVSTKKA